MELEKDKIHHPFKAPADYFAGLEDNILGQITIESIKKIEFKVQSDYFEKLENSILQKTVLIEKPTFNIWRNNAFKYAASLFLFASISAIFYLNFKSDPIEKLSSEEISAYLESETMHGKEFQMALEDLNMDLPDTKSPNLESLDTEEINAYLN
jgi:hypothetical protein